MNADIFPSGIVTAQEGKPKIWTLEES